jgi:hypothetical protein
MREERISRPIVPDELKAMSQRTVDRNRQQGELVGQEVSQGRAPPLGIGCRTLQPHQDLLGIPAQYAESSRPLPFGVSDVDPEDRSTGHRRHGIESISRMRTWANLRPYHVGPSNRSAAGPRIGVPSSATALCQLAAFRGGQLTNPIRLQFVSSSPRSILAGSGAAVKAMTLDERNRFVAVAAKPDPEVHARGDGSPGGPRAGWLGG